MRKLTKITFFLKKGLHLLGGIFFYSKKDIEETKELQRKIKGGTEETVVINKYGIPGFSEE